MQLTRLAINRRVTISMVILSLIVMGFVGLSRMPWDLNPKVEFPMITVTVPYPGAGPEEIEQRILRPLEDAIAVINGVKNLNATGFENVGSVAVEFEYGTDINAAAADVRDAVDRARASFPTDAKQPSLYKISTSDFPVLQVGISGQRSPRDLRKMVDDVVAPQLGQVPGTAAVVVSGGELREVQVLAHKDRLDAVGLSIADFARRLAAENLDVPSGDVKEGSRDYAVRVIGQFTTLGQIRQVRVKTPLGGIVPLTALAEVEDNVVEPTQYERIDGQPTVSVSVLKQADSNTVAVVRGAREVLRKLVGPLEGEQGKGSLPSDIRVVVARDDSQRVVESIQDVRQALMLGALLAALVVFLFLHNFRGTLIVAVAIPTSIMATFLPVGLGFGFSLNMMVMLALSLATGILVDDSIVVLENIERHLERGEEPKAAAFNGRTEIGGAAVAITLVDVVVFVPVALMGGIVGRFFFPFGITSFVCTSFSLLMSFTLTPMLASWWYTRRAREPGHAAHAPSRGFFGAWDAAYRELERVYRGVLRRALAHPFVTVIIGYAALIFTIVAIMPRVPKEFFPASDAGQVAVTIETAVGTRLEATDALVRRVEALLLDKKRYPEVEHVAANVGGQGAGVFGTGNTGGQYAEVDVSMPRRRQRLRAGQRTDQQFARDLRRDLADIPSATIKVKTQGGMGGGGGGSDVSLSILCDDTAVLGQASAEMLQKVSQIPGLLNLDLSAKPGRPEIHAEVDRLRAADLGMSAADIGAAVRTAFAGDTTSKFRESGDEYDLRVQLVRYDRESVNGVADLFIGTNSDKVPVRLKDVARVFVSAGPSRVDRYNRQRQVSLTADLDRQVLLSGPAQEQINQIIQGLDTPGVSTKWTGMLQMQSESFGYMGAAMLLAIVLVYIVTAGLYNSVLQPMNVMLTIPMAMVGGILGLWVTHGSLSVVAMIGVIQLVGLVGKNSILVVDYTNTLRARGAERTAALLEAGPTRMRPILMTTFAATMGALPTALAVNEGSEWRAPMAVVVIFGLLVSTLLSLLIVPATYSLLDRLDQFSRRSGRWLLATVTRRRPEDEAKGEGPPPEALLPPAPPAEPLPPGAGVELLAPPPGELELPGPPLLDPTPQEPEPAEPPAPPPAAVP